MTDEMTELEQSFTMGVFKEADVARYEKLKAIERQQLLENLATEKAVLKARIDYARGKAQRTSDLVQDMLEANGAGLDCVCVNEGILAEDKIVLEDFGFVVEGSAVKFNRGK